jgi:alkylation response protein AidB-like acyl-CoA dehydrogenase
MLARVRELRPLIEANRRWAHDNARMAPAVLEACREIGLFLIASPVEVGGADASLPELLAVFEELGYSDPTVGWHLGNSASFAIRAVYMDELQRERVFAGPRGPFGFSGIFGGVAQPVDGGYQLQGRWQFVTGGLDVPWVLLFGSVHEGGAPRVVGELPDNRMFVLPAADFVVERTWEHATAMRGTGSHAVVVNGAVVPEEYATPMAQLPERYLESKASRWPFGTAGAVGVALLALGIARRTLDEVVITLSGQKPRMDYSLYRDRSEVQVSISNAKCAVSSLSAGWQALAQEMEKAAAERRLTNELRADMWGMFFHTLDQCRCLVSELARLTTSAFYSTENPLELCVRDMHAISASMEALREIQWAAGKVLLGMPPAKVPHFV